MTIKSDEAGFRGGIEHTVYTDPYAHLALEGVEGAIQHTRYADPYAWAKYAVPMDSGSTDDGSAWAQERAYNARQASRLSASEIQNEDS